VISGDEVVLFLVFIFHLVPDVVAIHQVIVSDALEVSTLFMGKQVLFTILGLLEFFVLNVVVNDRHVSLVRHFNKNIHEGSIRVRSWLDLSVDQVLIFSE
jgi:hypothetical protein